MATVYDNIIFALQRTGGVSRFWSKLTERHATRDDVIFVEPIHTINLYRQALSLASVQHERNIPVKLSRYFDVRKEYYSFPYIFHSSYYRSNPTQNAINVTTVHDMIYERFDSGVARWIHVRQKTAALHNADCIVCVSDATRQDLLHFYPFCRQKRIEIIHNGVDSPNNEPTAAASTTPAPSSRYVLYVGHRGACKGFDRVYDLLDALPDDVICLIVGAPFDAEETTTIAHRGLADRIVHSGRVSDAELANLYANASFFFFPSLYEGFGIPPLEAMAKGCPVLATNRSSVPEVVGDAALMFDPDDRSTMILAAQSILDNADLARDMRIRGLARARTMEWRHALDQYDALYDDLLSTRLHNPS